MAVVFEDCSLDRFLIPDMAIFYVVDNYGRKIGELHPRFMDKKYISSALSLHPGHTQRCSRARQWNITRGEPLRGVNRVLIHCRMRAPQVCLHTAVWPAPACRFCVCCSAENIWQTAGCMRRLSHALHWLGAIERVMKS